VRLRISEMVMRPGFADGLVETVLIIRSIKAK